MALSVLSQASALNPGSDLWIIPDAEHSRWSVRIDWYLNFQVCKAQRHVQLKMAPYIEEVLAATETARPVISYRENAPLLISSESLLPNKWVAVIPVLDQLKLASTTSPPSFDAWVEQIAQSWDSLDKPSLRIFLPAGQNAGSFHELWQNHHKFEEFTVVLD